MRSITEIAIVDSQRQELCGNHKADPRLLRERTRDGGKLILVTALSPAPAGGPPFSAAEKIDVDENGKIPGFLLGNLLGGAGLGLRCGTSI